jgi:aminoglycoside phosphotransferase (APT) family kinase protein
MLPGPLATRWENAIDNDGLWQFEPVVVHGSFTSDALLVQGDSVTGVIGWHSLRVGDPARDMNWLINADDEARTSVFDAYAGIRLQSVDPNLMQRANLYNEIDVARWLLHGIDKKSSAIVDDAAVMLDQLVAMVMSDDDAPIVQPDAAVLDVNEVEVLLEETPVYRPLGTINE